MGLSLRFVSANLHWMMSTFKRLCRGYGIKTNILLWNLLHMTLFWVFVEQFLFIHILRREIIELPMRDQCIRVFLVFSWYTLQQAAYWLRQLNFAIFATVQNIAKLVAAVIPAKFAPFCRLYKKFRERYILAHKTYKYHLCLISAYIPYLKLYKRGICVTFCVKTKRIMVE